MTVSSGGRLAAIAYQAGFPIDEFLTRIAGQLRAEGTRLGGALQENVRGAQDRCAAMSLVDLPSRTRFQISQDLGSQAEGCRLDARGIAEFIALFDRAPDHDVELMILNRFGRAESEGGGLRPAFARAMEAGIPVLTAVRAPYDEAWSQFHGHLACDLPANFDAVLAWCRDSVRLLRAARHAQLSPAG
jgi:nucleoside-triphosphatase THEP1